MITPEDLLKRTLIEVENGEITSKRIVIICLDDEDSKYDLVYRAANISASQALALLEVVKTLMLEQMGY